MHAYVCKTVVMHVRGLLGSNSEFNTSCCNVSVYELTYIKLRIRLLGEEGCYCVVIMRVFLT